MNDLTAIIENSNLIITFHSGYIVHTSCSLDKKLIDFHEATNNNVYKKWMSTQKESKQSIYENLENIVDIVIAE